MAAIDHIAASKVLSAKVASVDSLLAVAKEGNRSYIPRNPRCNPDDIEQSEPVQAAADNPSEVTSIETFLRQLNLEHLLCYFKDHAVTMDILVTFKLKNLEKIGITKHGEQHAILRGIVQYKETRNKTATSSVQIEELGRKDSQFLLVNHLMQATIAEHRGNAGGRFSSYTINKIEKVTNSCLWEKFVARRAIIDQKNGGDSNENFLFHGTGNIGDVILRGFDLSLANPDSLFGQGLYFSDVSSKCNQYSFGPIGTPCPRHNTTNCHVCERKVLCCRVLLGETLLLTKDKAQKFSSAPDGFDSVAGVPSKDGLDYYEYVVYEQDQAFPEFIVTYQISQ